MKEIEIQSKSALENYHAAQKVANGIAEKELGEYMTLSWYEDYGRNQGAALKMDIDAGRFVYFYRALDDI